MKNKLDLLRHIIQGPPYRQEKPIVIQFPVIDICNSQCQMCKIWENKKSDDITPERLREGLSNPLFTNVRAVGLNGGEPTLRKDLAQLVGVLFEKLPSLKHVSLITNSYRVEEVTARISEIGRIIDDNGAKLDVMVSLDGVGEVHDRVRGKPGNFERARRVLDFARAEPVVNSIRIGCTVIKENVFGVEDLLEFCIAENLYVKYRLGIPHLRLYTADLQEPYALTREEKYHFAEFLEGLCTYYEPNAAQRFFYKSLIGQVTSNKPRKAGCDWQHRGATITSKGDLLYCAVKSKNLGRIYEEDANALYFGNKAHLDEIVSTECDGCNHDYVGLPPREELIRQTTLNFLDKMQLTTRARQIYARGGFDDRKRKRGFASRIDELRAHGKPAEPNRVRSAVRHVMIAGWYGTETLGDKAILAGLADAFRANLGDVEFTLVSLNPYVSHMTVNQMPEMKGWTVVGPEDAVARVTSADLLAFGGGPIMGLQELAEMQVLFETAHKAGVPTMIAGCGVGPIGLPHHKASIARILELADIRIFRDLRSSQLAAELDTARPTDMVAEDPAFTWLEKVAAEPGHGDQPKGRVLLLGLRDFPGHQYASHLSSADCENLKGNFEASVVDALAKVCDQNPDLTICPLPMCTNHFGGDDRWFYRRLFRGASFSDRIDTSLLGRELPPIEYCHAFESADAVLAMRFHATVFSVGLGHRPVVLDYTLGRGKVAEISKKLDLACIDLADLGTENLVDAVTDSLASRRPVADQALMMTKSLKTALGRLAPSG